LQGWLRNGWLVKDKSSAPELGDLLSVIDRDLRDCRASGRSTDWQLNIAYNAALQVAVVGLAAEGFGPRESHIIIVLSSPCP